MADEAICLAIDRQHTSYALRMLALLLSLIALAIFIWGGDRLLALVPGSPKLIMAIRVIAIVCISLYVLTLIAEFFGVSTPWPSAFHGRR